MYNKKYPKLETQIKFLSEITDSLDMPLDKKIIPLVAILRELEFNTTASCAGHLDGRTPWIDIRAHQESHISYLDTAKHARSSEKKLREIKKKIILENNKERSRLSNYLKEFYLKRSIEDKFQLITEQIGVRGFGGFRLHVKCSDSIDLISQNEPKVLMRRIRKEFYEFTEFIYRKLP